MCKCCFGPYEKESCGWPKGTVRAIVSLITIPLGFISSVIVMIILIFQEQYTIALGVNSVIWGVIGTIIGHYFGSKQAEGAANIISKTEQDLIKLRKQEISLQRVYNPIETHDQNNNNPEIIVEQ